MGATVLPGVAGYGRHGYEPALVVLMHRPERQPLIVEIVDTSARVESFLPLIATLDPHQRLATLQRVRLHSYGADS
jgi:PII-like signaling protein